MAQNTFKAPPKVEKAEKVRRPRRPNPVLVWLNELVGLERLFGSENAWPIRNLERILWVSLLVIIYIGLNHNAERLARRIQRTKVQVDELRSQYTTAQASFMKNSKQSEVTRHVEALGLTDSRTPPYKIVVKESETPANEH